MFGSGFISMLGLSDLTGGTIAAGNMQAAAMQGAYGGITSNYIYGDLSGQMSTSSATWGYWAGNTSEDTTDTVTWNYWQSQQAYIYHTPPQISQEERERAEALRRQQVEISQQRVEDHNRQKAEADAKALELLQDLITKEEFAGYQKHGKLLVKGRQHNYLIQKDSGHIVRLGKDKVVVLCMHIDDHHAFSRHDNVISMKLFLEAKEERFNKEANLVRERQLERVEQEIMVAVGQN